MTHAETARQRQMDGFRAAEVAEAIKSAKLAGIDLEPGEVTWTEEHGATVDGMPAADWLDHMTG